ncbi:MAG: hypothetical protein Q4D59_02815 [Erysipelotrichaceae bacterium]|jgi:hypothetical protein|nr:hypothetical protein [Erysipelotrichaceae bacterium]MDO5108843.1 hypothetical protein [Erysipelotrichaceae bacterium]
MTEKEIKTYRIVYFSTAALFLVIFMMTGRLIYIFFATVCMTIGINPALVKGPRE